MPDKMYNETLPDGFSFQMNLISSGSFNMGSTAADEDAYVGEKPQRIGVQIASFYLAPFTVTQALWKAVQGESNNPSNFKGDQHPVEMVSWNEAQAFIKALNDQTKANRAHFNLGEYRLPTEAEWEYAARDGAISTRSYLYVGSDKLKIVGWYSDNSDDETHEVGLLMPNRLGLYDMSGNVWEWVEDHWHDDYEGAPMDGRAWLTSDESASRVVRGGSYVYASRDCRIASRTSFEPDDRFDIIGFRLALSPSLGQTIPVIP